MSLFPLADCARLLGIHPKTLRQWIKQDALEMSIHPGDARVKCLTLAQVAHLADIHDRQLSQEISTHAVMPEGEAPRDLNETGTLMRQGECPVSSPDEDETSLLSQIASLASKVTTLTEQVAQLALALLETQGRTINHRLTAVEAALQDVGGKPIFLSSQPMGNSFLERRRRRLNQAEERVRSRLPPLIEYSAQGSYVIVSAQDGEVLVEPDEDSWFDCLATISSFRFIGQLGRFSACRTSEGGQQTRDWVARRFFHGYDFRYYLGVTDRLTIAYLEQAAAVLQSRVDAL